MEPEKQLGTKRIIPRKKRVDSTERENNKAEVLELFRHSDIC
jgi:hypothetical protein